jgi:hypothetical protein
VGFARRTGFVELALELPGRIPLPSKITIRVLSPIDFRDRLGPDPDPEDGARLVTNTMQQSLTALGAADVVRSSDKPNAAAQASSRANRPLTAFEPVKRS